MVQRPMMVGLALLCMGAISAAQSAQSKDMSLDEFRHYLNVLHIKEADERGVRVQMKAQTAQLPPWWPAAVSDAMISSMLQVDFAGLNFAYVKGCASSQEISALTAMFATPEGQQYAAKMLGGIVEQEGQGTNPGAARESAIDHDTGLPAAAVEKLAPAAKEQLKHLIAHGGMDCMNSGYKKASVDVTDARTKAVRAVIAEHHDELIALKTNYEATHPATSQ